MWVVIVMMPSASGSLSITRPSSQGKAAGAAAGAGEDAAAADLCAADALPRDCRSLSTAESPQLPSMASVSKMH